MWFNPIMRWLLGSPLHFLVSKNTMLMTYTGRKSGKSYSTPMNYLKIGDALYTISSRERVWWRNLRGGAPVTLRLQGKNVPAQATVIESEDQVTSSLARYLQTAPQVARYLDVQMNATGEPEFDECSRLAKEKVMVQTKLE